MLMNVYSVYDRITENYSQPILCSDSENHIIGLRLFKSLITPDSLLYNAPYDYEFVFTGKYDDRTGEFTNIQHEVLCNACDLRDINAEDTANILEHILNKDKTYFGEINK